MLDPLRMPQAVVLLSPHSDDVCFSVSALARSAKSGILLTLYSRSAYTIGQPASLGPDHIARVSEIRRREDAAFAAAVGLELQSLGLDDAPIRGSAPFGSCSKHDLDYVEAPLMRWISSLPAALEGAALAVPAGIGGHVDHLAVRDAVIANLPALQRRFSVCFYEDLHYASDPGRLQEGHASLLRALPGGSGHVRVQFVLSPADAAAKLSLVALYPSQLRELPADLAKFSVAGPPAIPHEAVWMSGQSASNPRLRT